MEKYIFKGISYFNQDEVSYAKQKSTFKNSKRYEYNNFTIWVVKFDLPKDKICIIYVDDTRNPKKVLDIEFIYKVLTDNEIDFSEFKKEYEINEMDKKQNEDLIKEYFSAITNGSYSTYHQAFVYANTNAINNVGVITLKSLTDSINYQGEILSNLSFFIFYNKVYEVSKGIYNEDLNNFIETILNNSKDICIDYDRTEINFDITRVLSRKAINIFN